MTVNDTRILGLLDALATEPTDDGPRGILADLLDELGPTPVTRSKLPNWLRLAWLRQRPEGARLRGRTPAGRHVVEEIRSWLNPQAEETGNYSHLDHWGSTTVAGQVCLANEPYATVPHAVGYLEPLARHLGCPLAFARQGAWNTGTVRVLLFPRPDIPTAPARPQGEPGTYHDVRLTAYQAGLFQQAQRAGYLTLPRSLSLRGGRRVWRAWELECQQAGQACVLVEVSPRRAHVSLWIADAFTLTEAGMSQLVDLLRTETVFRRQSIVAGGSGGGTWVPGERADAVAVRMRQLAQQHTRSRRSLW